MPKFRKKPVVVSAWKVEHLMYGRENHFSLPLPITDAMDVGVFRLERDLEGKSYAIVNTLEGTMSAGPEDWIIQGVHGELYPCKHDIFVKTYEAV